MIAGIPPTLILLLYPPSPSFYLSLPHDLVEFILGQAQVSNLLSLFPSNPANLFFYVFACDGPGHTHIQRVKKAQKSKQLKQITHQTTKIQEYQNEYKNVILKELHVA